MFGKRTSGIFSFIGLHCYSFPDVAWFKIDTFKEYLFFLFVST